MSSSNCCFLTCIQVAQEAGQVVWYSHHLKNFPVYCDPHKGFCIVNEAEIDVFLEFSWVFDDPVDVGNLISGSSAFSKTSLNIWKLMVHILLKPGLENFEHYFTSVWDECNRVVVWAFFGIAFLWVWNENWPFPVPWPLLSFSKFAGILSVAQKQELVTKQLNREGGTVFEGLACCIPPLNGKVLIIKPLFLLHNSVSEFLFGTGAQRVKILAAVSNIWSVSF